MKKAISSRGLSVSSIGPFAVLLIFILAAGAARANTVVADVAEDAKAVFDANCAACHLNGGNIIVPTKTLSKEHLQKYERFSVAAIHRLVKHGVGVMPAFKHLGDEKIAAVSAYVMERAEAGWQP